MSRIEKKIFFKFYRPQWPRSIRAKIVFSYFLIVVLLLSIFCKAASNYQRVDYYRKMALINRNGLMASTFLRGLVRSLILDHYKMIFNSLGSGELLQDLALRRDLIQKQFLLIDDLVQKESDLRNRDNVSRGERNITASDSSELKALFSEIDLDLIAASEAAHQRDMICAKFFLLQAEDEKFQKRFVVKLTSVLERQGYNANATTVELERSIDDIKTLITVSLFLGLSISAFLLFGMFRSVERRFKELEAATSEVASGNFDFHLPDNCGDELSKLVHAFNVMAVKLKILQRDLSQQHQLLAHSAKLSSMGEMAGGIAHEINTPLSVIKMLASQLKVAIESGFADVDKISLTSDKIDKTVDRISEIVKTLRSLSKNTNTEVFYTHPLRAVIGDAINLCSEKFKVHGVQLICDLEAVGEVSIDCQRSAIAQVIFNLLDNAFYAARLSESKWVKISFEQTHEAVKLLVADSGEGISEEIKRRLFQPFFTTKEFGSGTGLGLSISKNIVTSHSGNLVLNENSAYTEFEITLPKLQMHKVSKHKVA